MEEKCKNPFKDKPCNSTDIKLYITDAKIPICKKCWIEIADGDYQWSN